MNISARALQFKHPRFLPSLRFHLFLFCSTHDFAKNKAVTQTRAGHSCASVIYLYCTLLSCKKWLSLKQPKFMFNLLVLKSHFCDHATKFEF